MRRCPALSPRVISIPARSLRHSGPGRGSVARADCAQTPPSPGQAGVRESETRAVVSRSVRARAASRGRRSLSRGKGHCEGTGARLLAYDARACATAIHPRACATIEAAGAAGHGGGEFFEQAGGALAASLPHAGAAGDRAPGSRDRSERGHAGARAPSGVLTRKASTPESAATTAIAPASASVPRAPIATTSTPPHASATSSAPLRRPL